ncbi:unnamed protein product, partial [Parnassius mnemosyne]
MEFLLSSLKYDEDGTKQVKVCFIDDDEGHLAMKYLEGYRLAGYVLRIVPVGKANYENSQENNDNSFKQTNNQHKLDYNNSFTEPVRNNQISWSDKYDNPEPLNKNLQSDVSYVPSAHHLLQCQPENGYRALVRTDAEISQHTIGSPAQVNRYSHMPYNKQVTVVQETAQYTEHLSNEHQELYHSYDYCSNSPKTCSSKSHPALTQNDRYSYKTAPHRNNDSYKKPTPQLNTYNRDPMSPMTKSTLFTKSVKRKHLNEKEPQNKPPMKIAKMASGPNSVPNKNVYKAKGQPMVETKGNGHKVSTQPSPPTFCTSTGTLVSALMQPTRNANAVGVGAWEVESLNGKGKKSKKSLLVPTGPIEKPLPALTKTKAKKKNKKQRMKGRRLLAEMAASELQMKFPGEVPLIVSSSCVDPGGLPRTSGAKQPSVYGSVSRSTRKLRSAKRPGKKERAAKRQIKELKQTEVNANTVDSNLLGVAITCSQTGQLSKEIADKVLADIQKKIISEARNVKEVGSSGPVFKAKPVFIKGVLKLWCGDQKTLQWLNNTVSSLDVPTGVSLVVVQQDEIPETVRCGILIPNDQGVWKESHDIVRALVYQNSWVNMERWILTRAEEQPNAWFLMFLVPKNHVPILMEAKRRFTCGCGAVYIKFRGRGGKFFDVPPDWNATVTSNEIQNLSSRPDNRHKGVTTTEAGSIPTIDLDKIKSESIQNDESTFIAESGLPTVIEPQTESANPQSCTTVSVSESSPLPINDPKVTVSNNTNHYCTTAARSFPLTVIEPVEIESENTQDHSKLVVVRAGGDATTI